MLKVQALLHACSEHYDTKDQVDDDDLWLWCLLSVHHLLIVKSKLSVVK